MDIFLVTLLIHFIGFILGVGGASVSDVLFLKVLAQRKITSSQFTFLKEVSKVVWLGLIITYISGALLVYLQYLADGYSFYLSQNYFLMKIFLVLLITINGIAFHKKILPFLNSITDKSMSSKAVKKKTLSLAITGTLSIVSWYYIVFLAVINPAWNFSTIFIPYLLILTIGAFTAKILIEHDLFTK